MDVPLLLLGMLCARQVLASSCPPSGLQSPIAIAILLPLDAGAGSNAEDLLVKSFRSSSISANQLQATLLASFYFALFCCPLTAFRFNEEILTMESKKYIDHP